MKEEERANRRIKELAKRQEFVASMHDYKASLMAMKAEHKRRTHEKEEADRMVFNERRSQHRVTLSGQWSDVWRRNRSDKEELKA